MKTENEFKKRLQEIDSIFTVSSSLKNSFLGFLNTLLKKKELNQMTRNQINNQIQMYEKVRESSIKNAEDLSHQKLYKQAVVLLVSAAEATLKDFFEEACIKNIDKIKHLDNVQISFAELREKAEELDFDDCLELAVQKKLYSREERDESLNFQNLEKIVGMLDGYFEIQVDLDDKDKERIMLCYLFRNLIVHQLGIVDKKFIFELNRASIDNDGYTEGQSIGVDEGEYAEYSQAFLEFFRVIDSEFERSDRFSFDN